MIARRLSIAFASTLLLLFLALPSIRQASASEKKVKTPVMDEAPDGKRSLLMPDDVMECLAKEFPGSRLPTETDFNPEMLRYFHSEFIGVHPAVAFGDFNGDKKRDYMILLITGDTKWGPLCDLVVLNGERGGFTAFRLGEVYNFKDDYVSFKDNKLYKGRYRKGGWYINWDSKKNTYVVTKS